MLTWPYVQHANISITQYRIPWILPISLACATLAINHMGQILTTAYISKHSHKFFMVEDGKKLQYICRFFPSHTLRLNWNMMLRNQLIFWDYNSWRVWLLLLNAVQAGRWTGETILWSPLWLQLNSLLTLKHRVVTSIGTLKRDVVC